MQCLASHLAGPQSDGLGLSQRLSRAPSRNVRKIWAPQKARAVAEPRLDGNSKPTSTGGFAPAAPGPGREEEPGGSGGSTANGKQAQGRGQPDGLPEAARGELRKLGDLGPAPRLEEVAPIVKRLADTLRGAPSSQLVAVRRHATLAAALAALATEPTAPTADGPGDGLADPIGQLPALLQSCAHLALKPPRPVLDAFGRRVAGASPDLAPAEAVRCAWALSRLGWCTPQLLAAIERAALGGSWLQQLDVDGLVSLLWVCNRASFNSAPLLGAAVEGLFRRQGATGLVAGGSPSERRGPDKGASVYSRRGSGSSNSGGTAEAAAGEGGERSSGAHMSGRAVSLALYSCGALQFKPAEEQLQALCSVAARALPELTHQGVANIVWSLGRLSHHDPHLMDLLAGAALKDLKPYTSHELALLASGYASVGHHTPELLTGIATELAARGSWNLAIRDLSHVLSSMAKQHAHPGTKVLAALEKQVVRALRTLDIVQGQQRRQQGAGTQLTAQQGGQQARQRPQQRSQPTAAFPNTELCWLLWAFARLGHRPKALLKAVDESWGKSPVRMYELGPEDAGRALWALARLDHKSGAVLGELALVLRRLLPRMPPQSLTMALHGYATLGFAPHELLDGAAEHMAARLDEYPPQSVAAAVWAFAKLGVHPGRGLPGGGVLTESGKPLLVAVEDYATQRAGELSPQPISMLCWGLASLHHHPTYEFLDAMSARLAQHGKAGAGGHAATLHSLSVVAWAFAQWGHREQQLLGAVGWHLAAAESELSDASKVQQAQRGEGEAPQHGVLAGGGVGGGGELQWDWEEGEAAGPSMQDGSVRGSNGGAGAAGSAGLAPATVSNLAFALAKQQEKKVEMVQSLRRAAELNLDRYNAQELVNLLWCHAALGVQPPTPFLDAAAAALRPLLPACDASLAALAVHSVATLRYIPPDEWMEAAVRCVAEAVHDGLEVEEDEGQQAAQEQPGNDGRENGGEQGSEAGMEPPVPTEAASAEVASAAVAAAAAAGGDGSPPADAATAVQQVQGQQQQQELAGQALAVAAAAAAPRALRGGRAERRRGGGGGRGGKRRAQGVHVTLVSKLLWGCAHVGYIPAADLLHPLTESAQWALSHARARATVLHVSELVRLLWALAVLEQYHTTLYRNLCFRASRLPHGVPRHPASIQLLHQVAMLSSCEARFVSMPLRGNNVLPEWLREGGGGMLGASGADTGATAGGGRAVLPVVPSSAAGLATESVDEQAEAQRAQRECGHAAAEALAAALRAAGCRPAALRQLLYGDWVVVYRFMDSGQAAVLPWLPSLRAVNAPGRVVGSAVATARVLAAKGFPVVLAGEEEKATVAECLDLWT